ncbi:hypothetical protein EV421DRAFT_1935015 [Armillaria borealis]|uniref:Uncharacterized protein n=1 Tax=Armillaria borealis TaxID=47425 RepID=A0AA39JN48_9AGAR|nr:hypothetical protein EV421DRAFT_1935015 [Armillaria borealis]
MPSHRFEQYGTHLPVINPCEDPFTPKDFSHYEYIAWGYIQNKENLTPSKYVSALSGGFRDPLIRDWYISDMSRLSSLDLTSFLSEMRAAFLPKDWDKKLQSKILSSFQSPGQPVTAWITRLRWNNTLLRNTPYHLRDDELLSCFKTHVNPALARSARYDKETARECDLIQWISLIKAIEDSLPQPETAAVEDAKKAETPRSSIQTPTRKRSSSSAGNTAEPPAKRPVLKGRPMPITMSSPRILSPAPTCAPRPKYPPALTDAQRNWLKRQRGCFKCRRINVFHDIDNCPWGCPKADTYRGITLEDGVTLANPDRRESQEEGSRRRWYTRDDSRHGR